MLRLRPIVGTFFAPFAIVCLRLLRSLEDKLTMLYACTLDGAIFAARGPTPMPPILRAFEFATHPRVLMVGIPVACVVSGCLDKSNAE